jgi:hypothetical protein
MRELKYFVDFQAERKAAEGGALSNVLKIRGKAVDTSVNANRWAILPQDLDLVANELSNVPMLTDHQVSVFNIVGKATRGERVGNEVFFEAEVFDQRIIPLIENGIVKYVSISVDPEKTVCSTCSKETRDPDGKLLHLCQGAHEIVVKPHVRELSFVVFPAYKDTEISPVGFASAMDKYLSREAETPRSEASAPESLKGETPSGGVNVGVVETSHAPESVAEKKGDVMLAEEKKAQVDTTVVQTNPPAGGGSSVTYEQVISLLEQYTKKWQEVAEVAVSEAAKRLAEEARKKAEEAKKKAEEAEEAKKKAEEAEEAEEGEEAEEAEEASRKVKVSFGVTNAPKPASGEYPDWFMELWTAAKKQRAIMG